MAQPQAKLTAAVHFLLAIDTHAQQRALLINTYDRAIHLVHSSYQRYFTPLPQMILLPLSLYGREPFCGMTLEIHKQAIVEGRNQQITVYRTTGLRNTEVQA